MSLVAVDPNRDYRTEIMDEISRTYYPRRGRFLSDQEAYPTDINGNIRVPQIPNDIFNRSPIYGGAYNIPGAAGNLAQGLPFGVQGPAQGPNTPIKISKNLSSDLKYIAEFVFLSVTIVKNKKNENNKQNTIDICCLFKNLKKNKITNGKKI